MRRNFNTPRLVRLLADAPDSTADANPQDFAERLGAWVGVFDSVRLHAAHQSVREVGSAAPAEPSAAAALALQDQVHHVRAVLTEAITAAEAAPSLSVADPRLSRSVLAPTALPPETEADFAPFRKLYIDQQRNLDLMLGPLRANARESLSRASAELRQLAVLDAVWEQMLEPRERKLWPTVPGFLERRFKQLRTAHADDDPATWRQPGGWLDVFGKTLQDTLLAELDARLAPILGLMEALGGTHHTDGKADTKGPRRGTSRGTHNGFEKHQ